MNTSIAVVGAARTGKTLFCINFAEYLGARSLSYTETGSSGRGRGTLSPAAARDLMVNRRRRSGGLLRTFAVHLLQRPGGRIALIDTVSLKDKVPLPPFERPRLLLTLQALQGAETVLQMVDLSCSDPARREFDDALGRSLAEYCRRRGKFFLTAGSKVDLLERPPLKERSGVPGKVIFISSLTGAGFPRLQGDILGAAPAPEGAQAVK